MGFDGWRLLADLGIFLGGGGLLILAVAWLDARQRGRIEDLILGRLEAGPAMEEDLQAMLRRAGFRREAREIREWLRPYLAADVVRCAALGGTRRYWLGGGS
jgi:hypothetical protein